MNLLEVVETIDLLDLGDCLFARRPWSVSSDFIVHQLTEANEIPGDIAAAGVEYFLEVSVAIEVLALARERAMPPGDAARLLIYYAENDAFPDWAYAEA